MGALGRVELRELDVVDVELAPPPTSALRLHALDVGAVMGLGRCSNAMANPSPKPARGEDRFGVLGLSLHD